MNEQLKIIIADDHPLMRRGLKDLLEEQHDWEVIAEANNGEEVLKLLENNSPDVLIIDIDMPKMDGLNVAEYLNKNKMNIKTIILTMYDKENIFNRAMDLGVMGYVLKDTVVTEIADAVKTVSAGKYFISAAISGYLVKRTTIGDSNPGLDGINRLTTGERKILKMISKNMTTKEIAAELFISTRTVETHRFNICQKLDLHGTNSLLHFALTHREIL